MNLSVLSSSPSAFPRIDAHTPEPADGDDTDTPQIPSEPERHPDGLPDLPDPSEVGEDG